MPRKPKAERHTEKLTAYLTPETKRQLDAFCRRYYPVCVTISAVTEKAIQEFLDKYTGRDN